MNVSYEELGRAREKRCPAAEQQRSVPSFDSQILYAYGIHVSEVV